MKIHVTLTAAELAEADLSPATLHGLIVERLDTGTPSLPGFNVSIDVSPQQMKRPQSEDLDRDLARRHRLLQDFDFQGISIRYITQSTDGVSVSVSAIQKLETISKHELWINVQQYALMAAVIALKMYEGKTELQIEDIVRVLSDLNELRRMVATLSGTDSAEHENAVVWLNAFLLFWYDEDCEVWKITQYRVLLQALATKLALLNECTEVSAAAKG